MAEGTESIEPLPGSKDAPVDGIIGAAADSMQVANLAEHRIDAKEENTWIEYEDVLTAWEKKMVDVVDYWARKVCPFKCIDGWWRWCCCRSTQMAGKVAAGDSSQGSKHHDRKHHHRKEPKRRKFFWWEGMREDVPERYQRWEGIRERNTILSLIFGLFGHGRKQPTKFERMQLFILYASVWYLAYSMSLRRRGRPCRKAWVDACVPEHLGGGCRGIGDLGNCSSANILAMTPEAFNDYGNMRSSTRIGINIKEAECVKAGHSPCSIPLCAAEGATCEYKQDGLKGFCRCNSWIRLVVWDTIMYTFFFKLLYMPFWYLFVTDLEIYLGRAGNFLVALTVAPLYIIILMLSVVILWTYMETAGGVAYETMFWFFSFVCLCCFEVVKSFTFGMLLGSYVIRPICGPCVSGVWKFLLA